MPEQPTEPPEVSEVRTIRHLIRLMHRYDLTAIDLDQGGTRIRLRRRGVDAPSPAPVPVAPMPSLPAPASPVAPIPDVGAPAPARPAGLFIESPMVGTFYSSPSPDSPPFVSVGSVIRADSTVCIIEAMKVFTDIPAGLAGTVAEVLVKDGQPVEFGQHLFRIEPA